MPTPLHPAVLLFALRPHAVSAAVFWPWFALLFLLAWGFTRAVRSEMPHVHDIERIVLLGPVLYAAPMAVFGMEHLTVPHAIALGVPRWMPWHLFWVYFCGIGLIASATAIVARRVAALAATLLGVMLFIFVALLSAPNVATHPPNAISTAVMLRDLSFSAAAFALTSTFARDPRSRVANLAANYARCVIGFTAVFFGVRYFIRPEAVPIVPLEQTLPWWIPFHHLWAYAIGAALVVGGLMMLANIRARLAAAWLGVIACLAVLLVYLPLLALKPADIGVAMNYFADTLAFAGNFLVLAAALPAAQRIAAAVRAVPAPVFEIPLNR